MNVNVANNTVTAIDNAYPILGESSGSTGPGGLLKIAVTGNTANVAAGGTALDSIRVQSRNTSTVCAAVSGNTTNSGGAGFFGIQLREANTSVFSLEGLALGSQTDPTVHNFVVAQNPSGGTVGTLAAVGNASITGRRGGELRNHSLGNQGGITVADPFLAEIRIMSFGFPPKGWALCNGQTPADQPEPGALLAARDDLRRRRPDELRASKPAGERSDPHGQRPHARRERGGEQAHTLSICEIPTHVHQAFVSPISDNTNVAVPTGKRAREPAVRDLRPGERAGRDGSDDASRTSAEARRT